jgi:hypothetical protein
MLTCRARLSQGIVNHGINCNVTVEVSVLLRAIEVLQGA